MWLPCVPVQTLLLLSSVKAMRSFRLVQDHQVVPPWTCALLVRAVRSNGTNAFGWLANLDCSVLQ